VSGVSRKALFKNLLLKTADVIQKPADKLNTFVNGYPVKEEPSEADAVIKKKRNEKYIVNILTDLCMAYQGIVCLSCMGHCPKTRQGLEMRNGRPIIDDIKCNGCGRCVEKCSVNPSAIKLIKRPNT